MDSSYYGSTGSLELILLFIWIHQQDISMISEQTATLPMVPFSPFSTARASALRKVCGLEVQFVDTNVQPCCVMAACRLLFVRMSGKVHLCISLYIKRSYKAINHNLTNPWTFCVTEMEIIFIHHRLKVHSHNSRGRPILLYTINTDTGFLCGILK